MALYQLYTLNQLQKMNVDNPSEQEIESEDDLVIALQESPWETEFLGSEIHYSSVSHFLKSKL